MQRFFESQISRAKHIISITVPPKCLQLKPLDLTNNVFRLTGSISFYLTEFTYSFNKQLPCIHLNAQGENNQLLQGRSQSPKFIGHCKDPKKEMKENIERSKCHSEFRKETSHVVIGTMAICLLSILGIQINYISQYPLHLAINT